MQTEYVGVRVEHMVVVQYVELRGQHVTTCRTKTSHIHLKEANPLKFVAKTLVL